MIGDSRDYDVLCKVSKLQACYLLLLHANPEVRFIELVRDIPPQSTKFPPLLHNGMEETDAKEQLLPGLGLVASFEEGRVRDGIVEVGPKEIGTKTLGWFVGHLDS